jgi:hypothetical protein
VSFRTYTINAENTKKGIEITVSGDRVAPEKRDSLSRLPWDN